MTTTNPLIALIKQFQNIDLTTDFLTAFTHINQLSSNLPELYKESFTISSPVLDEYDSNEFEIIEELEKAAYNLENDKSFVTCELSSNIFHFFINKLSSNLKRLYSSNKKKGTKQYNSNPTELFQHQDIIYQCLLLMLPHLNHSNEKFLILNTFLGKTKIENLTNSLYYLAFHQHISSSNLDIHLNILNKLGINNIDSNIIDMCMELKFQKSLHTTYLPLFTELSINSIQECKLSYIRSDYSLLLLFHVMDLEQQDIFFTNIDKNKIISSLFTNKNAIQKLSFDEFDTLIPKFKSFFKYNQDSLIKQVSKIDLSNLVTHYFPYLLLQITEQPNVSLLYLYTLNDDFDIPKHINDVIIEKMPILKSEDLLPLINSFYKIKKHETQEFILINFINKFQEFINPQVISYMFGKLSPKLFPILIKCSHQIQFQQELNIENSNVNNIDIFSKKLIKI